MARPIQSNLLLVLASLTLCVAVGATLALARDSRDQVVPGGPLVSVPKFSVDDINMPVADAVSSLFQQAGKKYVFDLPATGVVTCHASNLSFFDALNILLNSCDPPLHYAIRDSIYHIGPLGTITGRVTLGSGKPAVGYTVVASPAQFSPLRDDPNNPNKAVTDADGRYAITLRKELPLKNGLGTRSPFLSVHFGANHILAKGYTLSVSLKGQSYIPPPDQNADPSSNPDWTATGIDFILQPSPVVVVKVTDAITGSPIPGVAVKYNAQWGLPSELGVTNDSGEIRSAIPTLKTDLFATLKPSPSAFEFAPGYGSGQQTSLKMNTSPGKTVVWNLKTYGTEKMSNWHGVVLDADGKAVGPGVTVGLLRGRQQYPPAESAVTDSQGRFSIDAYRFDRDETGVYPNGPRPVAFVQYNDMTAAAIVTPDESWDGITLRLAPGASISGTLVDPQGKPAAHVNVTLSEQILSAHAWPYPAPTTVSDAQGHFKLSHLPPGEYQISFSGGGYGDLAVPPAAKPGVSQITLPLSRAQHVDMGRISLQLANQVLSGIVTDDKGKIVEGAYITVTGDHVHKVAISQGDGTFHVFDLEAEPLTMTVGVSQDVVTKKIAVGQTSIKVVLPASIAEAVARDRNPFHAPAPPASPVGPPKLQPAVGTALLDGLALAVHPGAGSSDATAAIYRPNWLRASMFPPPFLGSTFGNSIPMVWHGTLADLDGVKLTVKDNHGILVDRAGRKLWSGVVVDPPDYTIVYDETSPGKFMVDLRDAKGKTLWSGPGTAGVRDQNIRIINPEHKVVWERGVGNARVSETRSYPGARIGELTTPMDGVITMHVSDAIATLKSSEGKILLTAPTKAVTFSESGFPAQPKGSSADGKMNSAGEAWLSRRMFLLPRGPLTLLGVQNVPPNTKFTVADPAGKQIGYTTTFNPTPKPTQREIDPSPAR